MWWVVEVLSSYGKVNESWMGSLGLILHSLVPFTKDLVQGYHTHTVRVGKENIKWEELLVDPLADYIIKQLERESNSGPMGMLYLQCGGPFRVAVS